MVKINANYKAVVLDFEKTLVSLNINWDPLRKTNAKIFKKYGFEIDYQSLRPIFEKTTKHLKYLEDLNYPKEAILGILNELLIAHKNFEAKSFGSATLYQDTKTFLDYIENRSLKAAILTSNLSSTVRSVLSRFGIFFEGPIVGREDVVYQKPDEEGIKKLLDLLQVKSYECVLIGDSDSDIEVAAKTGVLSIFIKRSVDQKLSYTRPDLQIRSLSEITFDDLQ